VAPLVALFLAQFGSDPITDGPPTLLLHGQEDTNIAFQSSVDLYDSIAPPKAFVGLPSTGHSELLESQIEPPIASRETAQAATIAFLDALFKGRNEKLAATLERLGAEGNVVESEL
jgi:hypothetical protein